MQSPGGIDPAALNGTLFDATGSDPGDYVLQFSLQNQPPPGCPSDYQVTIHVDAAVDAGMASQPMALCANDVQLIHLSGLITGADVNGTWTETSSMPSQGNAFNPVSGTFNTDQQLPGTYSFTYALPSNGACPGDQTEVTVVVNAVPTAMAISNVVIDCANPVQTLDAGGSSSGPQYAINWTGPGILQDGNEHTLHPTVDEAGNYVLTIQNTQTGCSSTASVDVIANTDAPTDALIDSQDPACFGDQNGFIHIDQVIGGEPPFIFMLNQSMGSTDASYDQLAAGSYDLVVEDANGCRWDTTITLMEHGEIHIDIGPDIELGLGASASVHAIVSLPADQIDTLIWDPASVITCQDDPCLDATVQAFNSMTLQATVYDVNGCQSTDQLNILVNKHRAVFIPSVFSPNGDGINDVFFVQGNESQILRVKKFMVFDRWGALVHSAADFMPNDPASGWDGHDKNSGINPGVFTYVAEVEFIDNVVLVYKGDVTVVR